jgi:hypothetical protein
MQWSRLEGKEPLGWLDIGRMIDSTGLLASDFNLSQDAENVGPLVIVIHGKASASRIVVDAHNTIQSLDEIDDFLGRATRPVS